MGAVRSSVDDDQSGSPLQEPPSAVPLWPTAERLVIATNPDADPRHSMSAGASTTSTPERPDRENIAVGSSSPRIAGWLAR